MNTRRMWTAVLGTAIAASILVSAQAPPERAGGPAPPAPAFDISGYWTSPLHEDGLERGAGPELGDYGGVPVNEAARLFALSYDPSRLTCGTISATATSLHIRFARSGTRAPGKSATRTPSV